MTDLFILKNSGEKQYNDVSKHVMYPVAGYAYELIIKPKCKFWRVGLRFSFNRNGQSWSSNSRYNDPQIRHVEACVGTVHEGKWQHGDSAHFQQYHFHDASDTLHVFNGYNELSEVRMLVRPKNSGFVEVTMLLADGRSHVEKLDAGFAHNFSVWGWADWKEFELECEMHPSFVPITINLNSIKALTGQTASIIIEKLAVFFGGNNSGKTSVLVGACNTFMNQQEFTMDYLGLNRVHSEAQYDYNLEALAPHERERLREESRKRRSGNSLGQNQHFDWMSELALVDEDVRARILAWVEANFEPWSFDEIKKGKFVTGVQAKVNKAEPLDQGSGARAALAIIIQLYSEEVRLLAIDEPELGLEPRMQKLLFNAIKDASEGRNGFPLKRIMIATHSHLFLDRINIESNFSVQKNAGVVTVRGLRDIEELQAATFKLLGSSPSDLFFPSNIIVVEGESDQIFLKAICSVGSVEGLFSSPHVVIHYLDGFDKLGVGSEAVIQMLKTQTYTPVYKDKICGLFDEPYKQKKKMDSVRSYFGDTTAERFVTLLKPAIEYFYPVSLINSVFGADMDADQYDDAIKKFLDSESDRFPFEGSFLNNKMTKVELARRVASALRVEHLKEIDAIIINLLKKADQLAFK